MYALIQHVQSQEKGNIKKTMHFKHETIKSKHRQCKEWFKLSWYFAKPSDIYYWYLLQEEVVESPEIHFEPVVRLPEVEVKSLEEDEAEIFKMYVCNLIPSM